MSALIAWFPARWTARLRLASYVAQMYNNDFTQRNSFSDLVKTNSILMQSMSWATVNLDTHVKRPVDVLTLADRIFFGRPAVYLAQITIDQQ